MQPVPEQGARSLEKRCGAAMARSGLKHGVPRNLSEGHVKLSLLSRELSIDRPIFASRTHLRVTFSRFYFGAGDSTNARSLALEEGGQPLPQARSTSLVLLQKQADPASSFLPQ